MSFVFPDTSLIFSDPTSVPLYTGNPSSVNATNAPTQLLASYQTFALTSGAAPAAPQKVVLSDNNNRLNIPGGAAEIQAIGGGHIIEVSPVAGDYGKTINLNLDYDNNPSAPYNGAVVDKTALVVGNSGDSITINQAAGGQGGDFAFYVHAGSGNDLIVGSFQPDFLRGGAGNDTIYAYAGDDLIRGGSGSDYIEGGNGSDTLYYTSDQMDAATDIFGDFVSGVDKISVDRSIISGLGQILCLGTKTIVFSGGTTVISLGQEILVTDIMLI